MADQILDHAAVVENTEKALDVVEDAIDGVVEVVEIVRNNPVLLAGAFALGLTVGGVGGYFFAKKRLAAHFERIVNEETADAKAFYQNLYKVDEAGVEVTPEQMYEQKYGPEALAALQEYQGVQPDPEEEALLEKAEGRVQVDSSVISTGQLPSERINAFEHVSSLSDDEKDPYVLADELQYRTPEAPYIITHDEFHESENETSTLTYWDADDTLVDEQDMPIPNTNDLIGDDHLVRFGHGSKDHNIVYIRNERLEIDFEIVKSKGSFTKEVLGLDEPDTLQHSDRRNMRRVLRDD